MTNPAPRSQVAETLIAILGTGVAFAFLQAGAFRDFGFGTVRRMLAPDGLRAAVLGAAVTAVLLVPVLIWQRRRARRGSA